MAVRGTAGVVAAAQDSAGGMGGGDSDRLAGIWLSMAGLGAEGGRMTDDVLALLVFAVAFLALLGTAAGLVAVVELLARRLKW